MEGETTTEEGGRPLESKGSVKLTTGDVMRCHPRRPSQSSHVIFLFTPFIFTLRSPINIRSLDDRPGGMATLVFSRAR